MKVLAFNGSPRKNWNTATLLNKALEGAASHGAETELFHHNYTYKGCASCFQCKRKNGSKYGQCASKDELTPLLEKVKHADAILIGAPVYFGTVNGETHSFLERLMFPYLVYDSQFSSLFPRKIPTAFIYTMGANDERTRLLGYEQFYSLNQMFLERIFGKSTYLVVTDTYQFDDYSKYVSSAFDSIAKAKRHATEFPKDCQKAYNLGVELVSNHPIC